MGMLMFGYISMMGPYGPSGMMNPYLWGLRVRWYVYRTAVLDCHNCISIFLDKIPY